ncbi:MAG: diacylglycerol kinase family protein [Tannerella sp.]|jgi:diacylglycerol kinase (ATP)|nr:diacylglycerol kinase family protein [Tannerella sp.]
MKEKKAARGISVGRLSKSFGYAIQGIRRMFRQEQNARVHLFVLLCTVIAGCCFRISAAEWMAVVIAGGCVMAAEAFNTSVEALSDLVSPEYSEGIRRVKDFAAGAVLLVSIAAAITGMIIFVPEIMALFRT